MEIKKGGCYKTRDGRKAFISKIDMECKVFQLKGVIQDYDEMVTWTKNGEFNTGGEEHQADLIEEWDGLKDSLEEIETLKEENEKLKKESEILDNAITGFIEGRRKRTEEIDELKSENEILRDALMNISFLIPESSEYKTDMFVALLSIDNICRSVLEKDDKDN